MSIHGVYEEAEGLDLEMVLSWVDEHGKDHNPPLSRKDYTLSRSSDGIPKHLHLDLVINQVFADFGFPTMQSLLRAINPRLRPWPTEAERSTHDGPWLCVAPEDGTACMGRFDGQWLRHSGTFILTESDRFALYWPCDANGNKVPWPKVSR